MKPKKSNLRLDHYIILATKEGMPENVNDLVKLVKMKYNLPEQEILRRVLDLESAGKLTLKKPPSPPSYFFSPRDIFSNQTYWYWTTIILALAAALSTSTIPEDAYPAVYARILLGTIFIWFLPGHSCIKALFPTKLPLPTSSSELDLIERVALSIGMSMVIVILNGFILNYTPYGIRTDSSTLSLFAVTMALATAAIMREFKIRLDTLFKVVSL